MCHASGWCPCTWRPTPFTWVSRALSRLAILSACVGKAQVSPQLNAKKSKFAVILSRREERMGGAIQKFSRCEARNPNEDQESWDPSAQRACTGPAPQYAATCGLSLLVSVPTPNLDRMASLQDQVRSVWKSG